jgi:hypothetical protein
MPSKELPRSSAIERVGYNDTTSELSIWFKGGRRYIYADVPRYIYDDLSEASSAGRYVGEIVRGRFACTAPLRKYRPRD